MMGDVVFTPRWRLVVPANPVPNIAGPVVFKRRFRMSFDSSALRNKLAHHAEGLTVEHDAQLDAGIAINESEVAAVDTPNGSDAGVEFSGEQIDDIHAQSPDVGGASTVADGDGGDTRSGGPIA